MRSKVKVVTLGCPKNVVDSEVLLAQLKCNDIGIVGNSDEADTIVINTCGFIQDAKKESIDAIIEAVEKKKKGELKRIVVMGCLPQRYREDLEKEIPEVDAFLGTNRLKDVLRSLDANLKKELLGERLLITPAHYAYLKISDGCDNPCSFCAIPLMRGKYRSRPVQEVVKEAKGLAKKGVKEIIVVAQDTTYYGLDLYGERQLVKLIGELNGIDGIEWIRLMYTYPSKFPTGIIEAYYRYRKLCRYIDIPVQHYADGVLKSMQRGITKRATKQLLERLKREIPGLAIRTTLIVGYPTETEDDFKELCNFVEEMRFHRLGVFTYSREEGTDAFSLEDPIPAEIKLERQDAIMQLQRKISRERNESLIGKDITVLIDTEEDNCYKGRTEWDAPEIDQEVVVRNPRKLKPGEFHTVTVTGALEYDLLADV